MEEANDFALSFVFLKNDHRDFELQVSLITGEKKSASSRHQRMHIQIHQPAARSQSQRPVCAFRAFFIRLARYLWNSKVPK